MTKRSVLASILFASAACGGGPSGGDDTQQPDAAVADQTFYQDQDGDGFGDTAKTMIAAVAPAGYVTKGGDCNDHSAAVHPGAAEVCDQLDNNCDGKIDDADPAVNLNGAPTFYRDGDGDGFGTASDTKLACNAPSGYVSDGSDCNDNNMNVHATATYYRDADNDGFGTAATSMVSCGQPVGYVALATDCADSDPSSHPGGTEICDGADNDCDGGHDGTTGAPNQCTALVGTYAGTYVHHTDERIGTSIINQMDCNGTGSVTLQLGRAHALQGTFSCAYTGGLTLFSHSQTVSISADVDLAGHVTGTITHQYSGSSLQRTYTVTGTQTASGITLSGTGSWFPNAMSAVAWGVTFSISGAK